MRVREFLPVLAWGVGVAASRPSLAQTSNTPRDRVAALAQRVVADLGGPLRAARPVTFPSRRGTGVTLRGDVPEEVRGRFEASLTEALGALGESVAPVVAVTGGDSPEAARAAGASRWLRVTLALQGTELRAEATLATVDPGPWETFLTGTFPAPITLAEATPSETYAPAPSTVTPLGPRWPSAPAPRPRTVVTPFRNTVALAVADMDGDNRAEIVMASPDRIRVARFTGTTLAFVPDAPGNVTTGWAAVPLRQPVGSIDVDASHRVVRVRTSSHAHMALVEVNQGFVRVRSTGSDLYPLPGGGCVTLRASSDVIAGVIATCDATPAVPPEGVSVLAPVSAQWTAADGVSHRFEARTNGQGMVDVRRDGAPFATLSDVAAPLVLADLDEDGRVELITASASAPGGADRVRVFTLGERAADERAGISVTGPIESMAAGDLDGDGHRELVVSVQDPQRRTTTLWILP
jgi:hypothetical protein